MITKLKWQRSFIFCRNVQSMTPAYVITQIILLAIIMQLFLVNIISIFYANCIHLKMYFSPPMMTVVMGQRFCKKNKKLKYKQQIIICNNCCYILKTLNIYLNNTLNIKYHTYIFFVRYCFFCFFFYLKANVDFYSLHFKAILLNYCIIFRCFILITS